MSAANVWRRRQLSQACDLQRAHLNALVSIHRRQMKSTVHRASLLAGIALHGLQLYRTWRRPAHAAKAEAATNTIASLVEAALAAIDYWRSPGRH